MISMKLLGSASVAALLVLAGCEATDKAATDVKSAAQAQTTPTLSTTDATFINTASQAGVEEIKFAQLAETQSHSARVKKFAMQMVTDHTAANEKLTALAQQKGITPTTTTDTAHDQMYTQLQGEHGRTFDRDYLAGQIKDHQMVADAMQTEIQSGTDADVKSFAQMTLPTIQQHLEMAQALATPATGMHHHHHMAAKSTS